MKKLRIPKGIKNLELSDEHIARFTGRWSKKAKGKWRDLGPVGDCKVGDEGSQLGRAKGIVMFLGRQCGKLFRAKKIREAIKKSTVKILDDGFTAGEATEIFPVVVRNTADKEKKMFVFSHKGKLYG